MREIEVTCRICGKKFTHRGPGSPKYCSHECYRIGTNERAREWHRQNKKKFEGKRTSLDDTLVELKKQGKSYAEMQKEKILASLPKIERIG